MGSFEAEFGEAVDSGRKYLDSSHSDPDPDGDGDNRGRERVMWVVVFSPTGCDAMLRVLGLSSSSSSSSSSTGTGVGTVSGDDRNRRIFIATIGPTTRDHLRSKYGVEPDVCAQEPSQDGVGRGIEEFMERWGGKQHEK